MRTLHLGTAIFLTAALVLLVMDDPVRETYWLIGWVYFTSIMLAWNINRWLDGLGGKE